MKSRVEFPEYLTTLGLTDTMVEVGTYQGAFARDILNGWPGHLVCIDPWRHIPGSPDILNHDDKTMEQVYQECVSTLAPFAHRNTIIRTTSTAAARLFLADGRRFDCVYIDAAHDYGNVVADLVSWWPLVKPGGVLAGHDYVNGGTKDGWPADFGVKQAVDEFVDAHHLKLQTTTDDAFPTWWVFKDAMPLVPWVENKPVYAEATL